MTRRTPEQELEHQMQKLKAMGVTVNVTPAPGTDLDPNSTLGLVARGAKDAGIYYEKGSN